MKKLFSISVLLFLLLNVFTASASTHFLNFPFTDQDIKLVQGWDYMNGNEHKGIDYVNGSLSSCTGSGWESFEVVAAASGMAMQSSGGGYGNFVVIKHDQKDEQNKNYFTLYGHFESINPEIPSFEYADRLTVNYDDKGKFMKKGDFLGTAGDTGWGECGCEPCTHLHLQVFRGGWLQNSTDPYDIATNVSGTVTREYYPGGSNYNGLGENTLWMPLDKTLAKIKDQDPVYWLQNGVAYRILGSEIIDLMSEIPRWSKNEIYYDYPPDVLEIIPPGHLVPEGAFLQGPDFIRTAGYSSSGLLIRLTGDPKFYLILQGKRRWITTEEVFNALDYDMDDVIVVTQDIIDLFPEGDPITEPIIMWGSFFLRINVGVNPTNWGWGGCDPDPQPPDYKTPECKNMVIGCSVEPKDSTVVAKNLNTPYSVNLYNYQHLTNPYEFARRIAYDSAKTGQWEITATKGLYSNKITTHAIDDVEEMPFLQDVALVGTGLTPTISWTVPPGAGADCVRLSVIDRNTNKKLWWSKRKEPINFPPENSETIAEGVLEKDHPYLIRALVEDTDSGTLDGRPISRAETYIPFTPLEEGEPNVVFLPTVGPDPDPYDEFGSAFMFNINVEEGVPCFIDPLVAVGYDYAIGEEDTIKFASVTLPEIGDNYFDLYLFDGSIFYLTQRDLRAGETFNFGPQGVHRFRVLEIDEAAGLDPNDTTAFITELTFTGTGKFTGTMTPILSVDNDGDGTWDYQDNCVNSDLSATVVIEDCNSQVSNALLQTGCTISDLIAVCAEEARNHGDFVSCVSQHTNELKSNGVISGKEKGAIQKCVAKAKIP